MKEITFLQQNAEKWQEFEKLLNKKEISNPKELASYFIELTDDLSYAQTYYPESKTTFYLNALTARLHQEIYKNKRENRKRIVSFWITELPETLKKYHREVFISFVIFTSAALLGALSAAYDDNFVRIIMGDEYVDMTLENIANNDPMAVYKKQNGIDMFFGITLNNIFVSFIVFIFGIFASVGAGFQLFRNGIMLGSFQYFFHTKGLLIESALTIWIHGTLEISAIVIAGGAGMVLGNGLLFPGTLSRGRSFILGAKGGIKIIIGLIPLFVIAGFLESFVTRHTEMPLWLSLLIIGGSLSFIIWYFFVYPYTLKNSRKTFLGAMGSIALAVILILLLGLIYKLSS